MQTGDKTEATFAAAVWEQIDADFDAHIEVIRSYLRQPSVSATGEGIADCAALTAELIQRAGGTAEVVQTPGHPAVLGRVAGAGPMLLRYGMYDVQPADEDDWTSPPFAAEIAEHPGIGRVVVARGAANSKACLAAFFLALESARKVADLPAGINFVVDGEEELGSINLPEVMRANKDRLQADAAFDLDLQADERGVPVVNLGCKGIQSLRLVCRGGAWGGPIGGALHSSEGAVIASPAWSLVHALAALVERDETPSIGGLPPPEVPAADRAVFDELVARFDPQGHLASDYARAFKGPGDARSLLEALVYGPVVNINGIAAGHTGGSKTIVPHEANAIVDIRLPHGTDASEVVESIRALVRAVAPEVEVIPFDLCPPFKTSPESPVAQAMIASHADVGPPAQVWPSAPWWAPYYLFDEIFGVPFAEGGAGHSCRAHATDEYASVDGIRQHMKQSIAFVDRFARVNAGVG